MKYVRRFVAIVISVLALVSVELAFAPSANGAEVQIPPPKITKEIPHNPHQTGSNSVVILGTFAWQTFVALNWPANCQGKPLSDKQIGEIQDSPRIWEFYRFPDEVFLPDGKDPTTIEATEPFTCITDEYGSNQEQNLKVRLTETALLAGEDELDEVELANSDSVLDDKGELKVSLAKVDAANKYPLVDRQGNYVINEIRINPDEFNQIVDNGWYDADNIEQFNNDNNKLFKLVCSAKQADNILGVPCSEYKPQGAIEMKAAWRVFDQQNSDEEKARYYTTKRQLFIPAEESVDGEEFTQTVEVGLIGFHIVQKTSEQGWVWSTFEQVDNVPDGTETKSHYTLYDPNCQENCDENTPYVKEPYLWRQEAPHAVTKVKAEIKNQIPSQISRLTVTESPNQVEELNRHWQDALKDVSESSIWQYYKLIGTEWLTNPQTPYNQYLRGITPARSPLANVVLEAYAQNISCITCHTSASLQPHKSCKNDAPEDCADFSFLIDNAQ